MEKGLKQIAQWVIDNRYPKSENSKVSDSEMYHYILDSIEALSTRPSVPSDEEIEAWVKSHGYYGHCTQEYHEGLEEGAKWALSRISEPKKGENNE